MGVNSASKNSKSDQILLHSQLALRKSGYGVKIPGEIEAQFDGPNLPDDNVAGNGRTTRITTRNLLRIPRRIFLPNIRSQIPPIERDF
jgi:hypothetical protein